MTLLRPQSRRFPVWSNVGGTGGQFSRSHRSHLTSFTRLMVPTTRPRMVPQWSCKELHMPFNLDRREHTIWECIQIVHLVLKDLFGRIIMYQCIGIEVRFKYSLEILIVFCLLSMYGFSNSPLHLPACPLLCSNSCNDMLADTAES